MIYMATNADRKLLALGVKSAALTAKELSKLLEYLLKALKDGLAPAEQKSYDDFQHPGGVSLLNISAEQTDAQGFTELARRNGVNISVKRDQNAGTYYLCLQGRQEDMLTAVAQYQMRQREQARPRSLSAELEQAKLQAASYTATQERKGAQRDSRDP